jgi:CRISPR-associated protein Csh1
MLDTLIKIGELTGNSDEWHSLTFYPKIEKKDDKDIEYLIYFLIFDFDTMDIYTKLAAKYDEERAKKHRNLNVKGGNNAAYYVTVHIPKHFEQLSKTLFGKPPKTGEKPVNKGELLDLIQKEMPVLKDGLLATVLEKIFDLKQIFHEQFPDGAKSTLLKLEGNSKVHLLVSAIKWTEAGLTEPKPLHQLEGYEAFILNKLLPKVTNDAQKVIRKLCYATGVFEEDVTTMSIDNRYSLNKMFVETTKNYASDFNVHKFQQNYQVSLQQQKYLEDGSKYVLEYLKLKIAGIDHCILPKFSRLMPVETPFLLEIREMVELLFKQTILSDFIDKLEKVQKKTKNPLYWLTFLGFESDGNFFKTINIIQSVNSQYFIQVLETFRKINQAFNATDGIAWAEIMTIGKEPKTYSFNFLSLYYLIPVRKDKEKRNIALSLFKAIFEARQLDENTIYQYFIELLLCHRFERYKAHTNIYPMEKSHFDFAVRNSVFQYLAFIKILQQLNLLKNMKQVENQQIEDVSQAFKDSTIAFAEKMRYTPYQKQLYLEFSVFFEKMGYDESQKALFYIGRILANVAYAQVQAKHKNKPILNKINYHGMDSDALDKFIMELSEKTQQYRLDGKNKWLLHRFESHFKPNSAETKSISKEKRVVYILLGYAFKPEKPETNASANDTEEDSEA